MKKKNFGKSKEGFSFLAGLILALIATVVILTVATVIIPMINKPEDLAGDGLLCRTTITVSNRASEISLGTLNFKKNCKIIEKTLPLKPTYSGVKVSNMNAANFSKSIKQDFAELIAKAWWITAEGDREGGVWGKMDQLLGSEQGCLVVYAARIHAQSSRNTDSFEGITQEDLRNTLYNTSKSQAFGKIFDKDQTLLDYLKESGVGAGVYIADIDNNTKNIVPGKIMPISEGNDAIYGVAIGLKGMSELADKLKSFFGFSKESPISPTSSFILIAPYDKISNYCVINNG